MNLNEKLAVVTGGASGIGRATGAALAEAGARVILGDIDVKGGTQFAVELSARCHKTRFIPLDITADESIDEFAANVASTGDVPDILVNAVGGGNIEPFLSDNPKGWDRNVALNYLGPIKLTHSLLGPMTEAGHGKIVFVASDAGRVGSSGETVYAGAKGGVIAFTKSLAREVARYNIHVNCVCPGPTDTPLLRSRPEKMREALIRAIPFRRFAEPEDIAAAIMFFAGPDSNYITGQVLSVSGGLTMVD